MPEIITISLIFAFAIFLIVYRFTKKEPEVRIWDEWKEKQNRSSIGSGLINYIAGFIIVAAGAYVLTGNIIFSVFGIPGAYIIGEGRKKKKEKALRSRLKEQYIEVLSTLIISMQGGASPYQALEEAVTTLPSPSKEVFVEIVRQSRTGSNYEDAVKIVAEDTKWDDLQQLQIALSLYSKTGANLIVIMQHMLDNSYQRQSDEAFVQGTIASTNMTAKMLSFLPFLLMLFLRFLAPDFAQPLFHTTGGIIVVTMVVGMVFLGNLMVARMVDKTLA